MPDYKAVLARTLSGLGDNTTPELRQKVFDKARTAIVKQLDAVSANLSDERKEAEKQKLEDAIVELEASFSSQNSVTQAPEKSFVEEVAPVAVEKVKIPDAQPEQNKAAALPEFADASEKISDIAADSKQAVTGALAATGEVASDMVASAAQAGSTVASAAGEAASNVVEGATEIAGHAIGAGKQLVGDTAQKTSELAGAATAVVGGVAATSTSVISDITSGEKLAGDAVAGNDAYGEAKQPRQRKKTGWIWLLLFLLLLGGGAFAAVLNKPAVESFLGEYAPGVDLSFLGFDTGAEVNAETQTEQNAAEQEATASSAETKEEPVPENLVEQPDDVVTKVQEQAEQEAAAETTNNDEFNARLTPEGEASEGATESDADTSKDEASLSENGTASEPAATAETKQDVRIAQRAYFYIEGENPDDASRLNGAVFWKNGERDGLPTIEGDIRIDALGIDGRFIVSKNTSPDLSASHLIEVLFDVPADFSGRSIDAIGRPLFKAAEDDAGNALMSQVARIDEGKFFVALFRAKEALDVNLPLLTDTAWIGIPATYGTGRRVLLNLEKGALGDQVFAKALLAWGD